jgi:hypothetical protein
MCSSSRSTRPVAASSPLWHLDGGGGVVVVTPRLMVVAVVAEDGAERAVRRPAEQIACRAAVVAAAVRMHEPVSHTMHPHRK